MIACLTSFTIIILTLFFMPPDRYAFHAAGLQVFVSPLMIPYVTVGIATFYRKTWMIASLFVVNVCVIALFLLFMASNAT